MPTKTTPKKRREWRKPFLEALAQTGNVSLSAQAAGINRATAYKTYHANGKFAKEWDDAVDAAADVLIEEARRRAVEGVVENVYHKGEVVGAVRKYSDVLLIFLLKGARPNVYRDNWKGELTGKDRGPVEMDLIVRALQRAQSVIDDQNN